MNQTYYESRSSLARAKSEEKPHPKRIPRWLVVTSVVMVWLLVALGCFMLARYYVGDIQRQLDLMAAANQAEVKQLNAKIAELQTALGEHKTGAETLQKQFAAVESQLNAVKEEMSLAGDSLSTTAETKKALSERINDLSNELAELRKLIKKLEEAARVY